MGLILCYHDYMDDNNKIISQNVDPVAQASPVQPQTPVQPAQSAQRPTGSLNKEVGPIVSDVSEFVKPTDTEPQIDKDLEELGIEARKDEPNIADESKQVIDHAKQFSPVPSFPSGKISLPMSENEVADRLKTGQDDDSGKWLAGLIRKIIAVMGLR